jgi:hypothetical protein
MKNPQGTFIIDQIFENKYPDHIAIAFVGSRCDHKAKPSINIFQLRFTYHDDRGCIFISFNAEFVIEYNIEIDKGRVFSFFSEQISKLIIMVFNEINAGKCQQGKIDTSSYGSISDDTFYRHEQDPRDEN